jgi:tyrosinase
MTASTPHTRYQRVREILDRAAGDSAADYGGLGRFWNLPLATLLDLEVHGMRMIAPAVRKPAARSCCDDSDDGQPSPSRGAASGLVRGLRGEPPFDGSQFPRLPWGGHAVASDDISFIADWIDDGCPAEDHVLASLPVTFSAAQPALEEVRPQRVEPATRAPAVAADELRMQQGEIKQRMNIDCMTAAQLDRLRLAFRELYALNKWPEDRRSYNNLALIHQNHCQHGWERFLPWHRIYVYEFEQALQDVCPGVTLPYWDWTMLQYRPDHPETGWIIPKAMQAYLTTASIDFLTKAKPPLPADAAAKLQREIVDKGQRYPSQKRFFTEVAALIGKQYTEGQHRRRFIDALLAANALWYPLRYPAEYKGGGTINTVIHYHYPTADDIAQIMSLRSFRDFGGGSLYNDSFGFIDQNPHNTMHIWTGGMNPDYDDGKTDFEKDLRGDRNRGVRVAGRQFHSRSDMYTQPEFGDMFSNLTASYDPVFWPIHVNVDRLWWEWQQQHAHANPADLDTVLTPWSYTTADTLDISSFGYEYVKSSHLVPIGLDAPVGRFVSGPIDVPAAVRGAFRQAEVRLHRVPQLPRSCFIRVFLNVPDANAATPLDVPGYAGYLAVFGHGPCYGGPGHCEIPPRRARPYDNRPRSHNTPRNHRIDITKAVRRLLDAGATSLQITLVAIGADYREDNEVLRLEGVSLNFLD